MVSSAADIVCFSHLGWDLVFQRPNHLMSRAAANRRVFYVEEPQPAERPGLAMRIRQGGVVVVTPRVPERVTGTARTAMLRLLVDTLITSERIERPQLWYYTPLALAWTDHLDAESVVYDCMDELSAFRNAAPELRRLEPELLRRADVVFTGGHRLYEAKRNAHPDVHAFPSAVDVAHFRRARTSSVEPEDQEGLPHPRIGYFGVIDERMDIDLLRGVATRRPDWSIVLVGPIVKIAREDVPDLPNIHLLGPKPYAELPTYLAGWDVAIMPFAKNEATAFISPTKTPEYLAGGRPVVSTSIADVVQPYGEMGLARIADDPDAFVAAIEDSLADDSAERLAVADAFLAGMSWDRTWQAMDAHAQRAAARRLVARQPVLEPAGRREPRLTRPAVRLPASPASPALSGMGPRGLGTMSGQAVPTDRTRQVPAAAGGASSVMRRRSQ
ncbi:MAG TPA: glycosyltransferase family 1 protein [Candidatus Limnocylindrales bacterium]